MENIKISNFRKIQDTWDLDLAPITFFTGTNNSGKSTIFKALMLLEDFVWSSNHFQLDFNGPNSKKHKIHSYKSAINRFMNNNSNWNLNFVYSNLGHRISLIFHPFGFDDDGSVNKGKLKFVEIVRDKDNSKLIIENTGGVNYLVKLDVDFLEWGNQNAENQELDELNEFIVNVEEKILKETAVLQKLNFQKERIESSFKKESLKFEKKGDLKDSFETWLNARTKEGSNRVSAYIKALELLSNKVKSNIFENDDVDNITSLYKDVLVEQKVIGGKYYDENAPSYGMSGFYSAALKKYKEFLENHRISFSSFKRDRIANKMANKEISDFDEHKIVTRRILDHSIKIDNEKKKLSSLKQKLKSIENPKKEDRVVLMPEFSLNDDREDFFSIDTILREIIPDYMLENPKEVGKIDSNTEIKKAYEFSDKIMKVLRFSVDHLGPHRNTQSHLFLNTDSKYDINDLIYQHSIKPINKTSKAGKFIKKWMKEFDVGDDYRIKLIGGIASQIEISSAGQFINLADKGFGAGQIFTILLKIALVMQEQSAKVSVKHPAIGLPTRLILIEEPEANLHPALQSKLADLFYETYKEFGIRFILETHSEYILRKSQVIVSDINSKREKNILQKLIPQFHVKRPFSTYYFDKDKGPFQMHYRADGKFTDEFGPGFFDVSTNLAFDIL